MLHCNPEFLHVVRPKTPRGDGNHRGSPALDHAPLVVSSDPKPREGTETFCLMLGRQLLTKSSDPKPREGTETRGRRRCERTRRVVRPKTPRGDGNYTTRRAISQRPPRRQTQNPERGRKPISGTATLREDTPSRQTQNPERGRKHSESHVLTADSHVVRPKTPRGDGNSRRGMARQAWLGGRQTQNPERGRKHVRRRRKCPTARVVRPKTPRGDGNSQAPCFQ
ncbi:Uncharacterised protein [Mycobacterium tuberculosis]|nr:Uncharacterised protein [Mycobacterium tuberculosis]